jgi:hypothetical protein
VIALLTTIVIGMALLTIVTLAVKFNCNRISGNVVLGNITRSLEVYCVDTMVISHQFLELTAKVDSIDFN